MYAYCLSVHLLKNERRSKGCGKHLLQKTNGDEAVWQQQSETISAHVALVESVAATPDRISV